MSVDSRLLIKQVEARPWLWNRDDKHYGHKQIVSQHWAEIALIQGVHESKVKSKWKALRDTFRQELKKNPEHSSWNHYLDMQFLKGQLKTRQSATTKSSVESEPEEITLVKTEPEDGSPYDREDYESGRSEEGDQAGPRGEAEADDDDYHFLMSLLPEMRKLNSRQKLLLRIKMMELFYKEAYHQEL